MWHAISKYILTDNIKIVIKIFKKLFKNCLRSNNRPNGLILQINKLIYWYTSSIWCAWKISRLIATLSTPIHFSLQKKIQILSLTKDSPYLCVHISNVTFSWHLQNQNVKSKNNTLSLGVTKRRFTLVGSTFLSLKRRRICKKEKIT